jgi:hypothetical protein
MRDGVAPQQAWDMTLHLDEVVAMLARDEGGARGE